MRDDQPGLRTRLVQVAMEMLAEGADALSLRSVARGAGVSAMAPYRHFPDKAALLRAVADRGFEMLHDALETGDRGGDREALVGQGLAYFRFAGEHPALFRLMFSNLCAPPNPADAGPGAHAILARRVESIVADPSAAATATIAAGAIVHGLALLALDGALPIDSEQARSVLTVFAQGLG
jgi:AcrR family transcriptional regulator